MTSTDLVLIDTCVWVPFFNRPQSVEKQAVDALLDEDRAALIGPVLAEILQGFRHDDRAVLSMSRYNGTIGASRRDLHGDWRSPATACHSLT